MRSYLLIYNIQLEYKMDVKQYSNLKMVVPLSIIVITIFMNIFLRQDLYLLGQQFIQVLQENSNPVFDWFFILITMVIDPTIICIGTLVLLIGSKVKQRAINMFIFIILNTYLAATFKAYYKDPRPIWTSDIIRNIGFYCPIEYGNPSGHSWFSVILGFGIILQYKGLGANLRYFFISVALMILVPFSRMYLGAHSLNQVLEGVTYGLVMCMLYSLFLKQYITEFLCKFPQDFLAKIIIGCMHIFYIIPFILGIGKELPPQWENNITEKCNKFINQSQLNFIMFTFNSVMVNIITGIAQGHPGIMEKDECRAFLSGNWHINQQRYQITRGYIFYVLLQIGLISFGIFPAFIISYYLKQYYILVFVIMSCGALTSGLAYSRYLGYLLFRWKIIAITKFGVDQL